MSASDRKMPEINPDYELAVKEREAAEAKVAEGVTRLYAYCRNKKNPKPDEEQKIATVTVSPEEAQKEGFANLFPNKLCNGVTVHFYEPGYTRHPPLRYMVSQKMQSLCGAAKIKFKVDELKSIEAKADEIIKTEYDKYLKTIRVKITKKWKKFKKENMKKYAKLKKLDRAEAIKQDYLKFKKEVKDKEFNKMSETVMQVCSGYALDTLHKAFGEKKIDKEKFSKIILKESAHHRSNNRDTLTFNEETNVFSYDGLAYFSSSGKEVKSMEPVTAHDKRLGRRCANLSMVFEGDFGATPTALDMTKKKLGYRQEAVVTSSLVKHSSLAPDADLAYFDTFTKSQKKLELLMQTANNAEDALLAQVHFRRHGQDEKSSGKTMHLDWNYELLTTNAGNNEKEATNFGYAVQATRLMNGATYQVGDLQVKANITLSNVGINKYGAFNFLNKRHTQPDENRNALIHQTEVLRKMDFEDAPKGTRELGIMDDIIDLKVLLAPEINDPKHKKLLVEYEKIQTALARNATSFNEIRKDYNENYKKIQTKIRKAEINIKGQIKDQKKFPHDLTRKLNLSLKKHQLIELKKSASKIEARAEGCNKRSKELHKELSKVNQKMEDIRKKHWKKSLDSVNAIIGRLRENPKEIEKLDTKTMLKLTALIYKTYMDNLYYAGEYRGQFTRWLRYDSKNAALYNAYSAAYQRAVGMMASTGCKSANDRTLVARALLAGIQSRGQVSDHKHLVEPAAEVKSSFSLLPSEHPLDLKDVAFVVSEEKRKPKLALPANYHNPKDTNEFDKLMGWVSGNIMSNSATHSCINDTGGGASKVSSKQFYFLEKLQNINFFKKFGPFAQHKMKKSLGVFFSAYDSIKPPKPQSRASKIFGSLFKAKPKEKPVLARAEVQEHKETKSMESDGPIETPRRRL